MICYQQLTCLDIVHLIFYCVHLLLIFPFVIGPSITCERGSVVKLGLESFELSGKIAPEISLLTNLVGIMFVGFMRIYSILSFIRIIRKLGYFH